MKTRRPHTKIVSIARQVFKEFSADNILKYSASLAYYTVFSIAPLIVVITTLFGLLFGKEAMQGQVYQHLNNLVGSKAALQIQDMIRSIHLQGNNFFCNGCRHRYFIDRRNKHLWRDTGFYQ